MRGCILTYSRLQRENICQFGVSSEGTLNSCVLSTPLREKERQTDRDRQKNREAERNRQTDRDREGHRQTGRQKNRQ